MDEPTLSRRSFLAAAAPATLAARQKSPNDRIGIGVIGAGGRGHALMREIEKCRECNAAVVAICDVYRPNREKAVAMAQQAWGAAPRQTVDYQELLGWKEVDAVLIATPDFGHSRILEATVKAGKDAYCEKPMGTVFAEAKSAYLAVKNSKQVVQIGTQRRSEGVYVAAAKAVRSGILGKVTRVETSVNFYEPRWRRDYTQVVAGDVAWKQFLMHLPDRPFDARLLREWQLFRDTTNGIPGLWMSHFIDLIPWFLDDPYPAGAVAKGGVYLWEDGRQTSDVFHALLDYPKGFLVSFSMSLTNAGGDRNHFYGSRGTLDMNKFVVTGSGSKALDRVEGEIRIEPEKVNSHMANFLECIRTRQAPRADIQAGFSHAVAGCMAAVALEKGRNIRFDPVKIEMV